MVRQRMREEGRERETAHAQSIKTLRERRQEGKGDTRKYAAHARATLEAKK